MLNFTLPFCQEESPSTFWRVEISDPSSKYKEIVEVKPDDQRNTASSYYTLCDRLFNKLVVIYEEKMTTPSGYLLFEDAFSSFSDANLQKLVDLQKLVKSKKVSIADEKACLRAAAMFKSLVKFLEDDDRYQTLDARFLLIFCVWQWFNLIKAILQNITETRDLERSGFKRNEFALVYKKLHHYLIDPAFHDVISFINKWAAGEPLESGWDDWLPYTLVLVQKKPHLPTSLPINTAVPIPGFERNKSFAWGGVVLHPVFRLDRSAKIAVKRLVTHFALPHYNLDAAIHLSHLYKKNQPLNYKHPTWLFVMVLLFAVLVAASISILLGSIPGLFTMSAILFWGYFLFTVDWELMIHLLLPRVCAGILVGYSALLLEGDSAKMACKIFGTPALAGIWIVLVLGGALYLFFDIRPWSVKPRQTLNRTGQILLITLILSVLIGFLVLPLANQVYGAPGGNTHLEPFSGPFGLIDLKQFLTFVPLALLTGLISQFIFEEEPLTTSVWAPQRN